jgi:hypothetical protein
MKYAVQWVSGALSQPVKQPARVSDRSPPSSANAKNA